MSHFRGDACRSLLSRVFVVSVFAASVLGVAHQSAHADCAKLLNEVERASTRPQFRFEVAGNIRTMPSLRGRIEHGTSAMANEFVYFPMPGAHADYSVVRKSLTGFGFSTAPKDHFELIDSSTLQLRDLKVDGTQSFFVAMMSSATVGNAVVLKLAVLSDAETGRLEFGDAAPLAVEGLTSAEAAKLAARPGSSDFWMVDGSDSLKIIQFGEAGLELGLELSAKDLLAKDLKGSEFTKIEAVSFVAGGSMALVTASAKSGRRWIVPVRIVETPTEKKDEMQVSYQSFPERAFEVEASETLSARPDKLLFVLYSADRVKGLALNAESLEWSVVMDEKAGFLLENESISGFEYYWDGILQEKPGKKEGGKPQYQFVGELQAYALVYDNLKNETRVNWLHWGRAVSSSPSAHSFMNAKK